MGARRSTLSGAVAGASEARRAGRRRPVHPTAAVNETSGPGGLLGVLFENNPRPMWVYDLETLRFLDVNNAAIEAYGYARERFLAMTLIDIRPENERRRLRADLAAGRAPLRRSGPWTHLLADGSTIEVEITSHELLFGDREAALVVAEDVTERNRLQARIRQLEVSDPVTGLPNRGALLGELDRWIAQNHGAEDIASWADAVVCMVHLDPDGLTAVNSRFGYEAGDRVLHLIGGALTEMRHDMISVGRIGGGEFAAATALRDPSEAPAFGSRLLQSAAEQLSRDLPVTVTCGLATAPVSEASAEALIRDSITATRWAKVHRRGGVATAEEAVRASDLEIDLRTGIADGELVAHYQPVVSVSGGQIVGAEALVRWNRPGTGLVPPSEFIGLAEQTGLITDIWRWVVGDALAKLPAWQRDAGVPLSVSLNLSARQFSDPSTVDHFVACLAERSVDPRDVVVEVTETAAASDPVLMHEVLSAFRLLEVRIALDDFGTGYSTLAELERTPFDALKIDRSFISRLGSDPRQRSIVAGMVRLAHTLGMVVVAEGVETAEQLRQLTDLGV
ncbi:MAG TPA: bifunctional diguanylate cyclase/phosphodiesterase, partial [Acidimicrobiales bacterium]|nr:bifunctional diguanylate cyclase/phosphodiesterase [Acidimicrobiales bacterium]